MAWTPDHQRILKADIAFEEARSSEAAGVGHGIYLLDLKKAKATPGR